LVPHSCASLRQCLVEKLNRFDHSLDAEHLSHKLQSASRETPASRFILERKSDSLGERIDIRGWNQITVSPSTINSFVRRLT